jgi:hypothetical protein
MNNGEGKRSLKLCLAFIFASGQVFMQRNNHSLNSCTVTKEKYLSNRFSAMHKATIRFPHHVNTLARDMLLLYSW